MTMTLDTYLASLTSDYYTAESKEIESGSSTIIHADATTTPGTWTRHMVWLQAVGVDYSTCFHYVTVSALGRLSGTLTARKAS